MKFIKKIHTKFESVLKIFMTVLINCFFGSFLVIENLFDIFGKKRLSYNFEHLFKKIIKW